jgi:hypothetical protein
MFMVILTSLLLAVPPNGKPPEKIHLLPVLVATIEKAYDDNGVEADSKYKNTKKDLIGEIKSISQTRTKTGTARFTTRYTVVLVTKGETEAVLRLKDEQGQGLTKLKKGDSIKVEAA